jgi:hypothetical protein
MTWRSFSDSTGDNPDDTMARRLLRRTRRHTPPRVSLNSLRGIRRRGRASDVTGSLRVGNVEVHLTPRQAVMWLLNLDAMLGLYDTVTGESAEAIDRQQVEVSLRAIIVGQSDSPFRQLRPRRQS